MTELKEALECQIEHLEGEHEGKVVVCRDTFNTLYDAATKYAELEPVLKEVKEHTEAGYEIYCSNLEGLANQKKYWEKLSALIQKLTATMEKDNG